MTFSSQFRIRAQTVTQKRAELSKSAGGLRKKSDLSDSAKWNLGDANQFSQILLRYQEDLVYLKELREQEMHALRELQSSMLKGVHLNRFVKPVSNPSKLGPGEKKLPASTKRRTIANFLRC